MNIGKIFFAAALCAGISAGDAKENHVKEVFQPLVDEYAIPGAVTVVATKDKILDLSAVGWANVEEQKPMKKNMRAKSGYDTKRQSMKCCIRYISRIETAQIAEIILHPPRCIVMSVKIY